MTARERLSSLPLRRHGIAAVLAVVVFVLAYDDGAYSLKTQATSGVIVWWAILLAGLIGVANVKRLGFSGVCVAAALTGFAVWTLFSAWWSASAEASVADLDRTLLYLGVFLFVGLVARAGSGGTWADGLAAGISAIAVVALSSRLFPTLFSHRGLATFLPGSQNRLSFPLGYWNGLGIFCALAVPLLLRPAILARRPLVRGLALMPVPIIVADIYLASSRGAVATLLVATIVLLIASPRRPALIGAIGAAACGSAVTIGILLARRTLVDGPLEGAAARSEGRSAAWLIALACLATGAGYALACRYWPPAASPSRRWGRVASIFAGVLAVALVVVSHPVMRFNAFKQSPDQVSLSGSGGFVRAHLLSGNGSGRWQFWTSAIDEWRTRPWTGRGAGSFEAWWAANGSLAMFVKDAHSLYLQTLGELGLIGLALLLAVLLGGVAMGIRRVRRSEGDTRVTNAALLAVLVGYAVAAGIDWMWELTIVSLVAMVCLALIVGAATTERVLDPAPPAPTPGESPPPHCRGRLGSHLVRSRCRRRPGARTGQNRSEPGGDGAS